MTMTANTSSGGGKLRTAGTRGVVTGIVLVALGLWSVLVPLVGPYFDYALSPAGPWSGLWAALWLQIVPGAVLVLCGLVLTLTQRRVAGLVAGALAAAAGVWIAIGSAVWPWAPAGDGAAGPAGADAMSAAEQVGMSSGVGAVVTLLAGLAVGRFSVRGTRDVAAAQRRESERQESERQEGSPSRRAEAQPVANTGSSDRGAAGVRPAVPTPRHSADDRPRRPTDA